MVDSFWRYAEKQDGDVCWNWSGPLLNPKDPGSSYGLVRCRGYRELAHRFSYEIAHGPLNGLWALHRCDNPRCVNPAHIYAGTPKDNGRDMSERHRKPTANKGVIAKYATKYPCALTDAVIEAGLTLGEFSRKAGIPSGTVYMWARHRRRPSDKFAARIESALGKSFAEVFGTEPSDYTGARDRRCKATPEHKARAVELRAAGLSYEKVAAELGLSWITVYRWFNAAYDARCRVANRKRAA